MEIYAGNLIDVQKRIIDENLRQRYLSISISYSISYVHDYVLYNMLINEIKFFCGVTDGALSPALSLSGTMLGFYPIKVLPSMAAIAPVNPTYLPQVSADSFEISHAPLIFMIFLFSDYLFLVGPFWFQNDDEREMCARTIYCTNIDKKVLFPPYCLV